MSKLCYLVFLLGMLVFTNCSQKEEESDDVIGTITATNGPDAGQNTTVAFTYAQTCTYDSDTGTVAIRLQETTDTNSPFLVIHFKGYSTTPATYTCLQAADNSTDLNSVGSKYDDCGVIFAIDDTAQSSTQNWYSMFRNDISVRLFNYAGNCTVNVTETNPTIRGTVNCTQLVRTYWQGAVTNPIDTSKTLDISGDFYCTFD